MAPRTLTFLLCLAILVLGTSTIMLWLETHALWHQLLIHIDLSTTTRP
jgi:hypothetical protein